MLLEYLANRYYFVNKMEKSLKKFQTPISEELIRIMTDQPIVPSQGSSIFLVINYWKLST